jgi:hypothetical protein
MHDWEPMTLVNLYQQYVDQSGNGINYKTIHCTITFLVTLADLEWVDPMNPAGGKVYNPYNKWNTDNGIMHLNCPPNSLSAEINLAAFATVVSHLFSSCLCSSISLI